MEFFLILELQVLMYCRNYNECIIDIHQGLQVCQEVLFSSRDEILFIDQITVVKSIS
jgi:hypothetical protein